MSAVRYDVEAVAELARLIDAEADQSFVVYFRHVDRAAVRAAEAEVAGFGSEHVDLLKDLA